MSKEEVIKITLEIIKEKKLEKTSVGEIVKRLDISPGNLYYYFRSKNEIYKEVMDYSLNKIIKSLSEVKDNNDSRSYLFDLSKDLIKFLEENEEILNFLISMKGSCYLEEESSLEKVLSIFKRVLLNLKKEFGNETQILLKARMFFGSVFEVLYKRGSTSERVTRGNL